MRPFVAIDFETANEKRRSACAIGLVSYDETGQIDQRYYRLVRPHPEVDYFSPINTWVHGITADDVADAPQFDALADEITELIGDKPLVAHNMAFDGYVLSDLADLYGRAPFANRRFCTLRLARRILAEELQRKSLTDVYGYYFPGEVFAHHDASADAEACGRIFSHLQTIYPWEELETLCPPPGQRRRAYSSSPGASAQELIAQYGASQALKGERVVITGKLTRAQRGPIKELIGALGATAQSSVTKATTMLVVGVPNPRAFAAGASASSKMQRASELRAAGSPIQVLSEEEFFDLLADE